MHYELAQYKQLSASIELYSVYFIAFARIIVRCLIGSNQIVVFVQARSYFIHWLACELVTSELGLRLSKLAAPTITKHVAG